MKENILITGGAGYIGSALAMRLIKEGYNVTIFDSLFYNQKTPLFFLDNILSKDISIGGALLDDSNESPSAHFKNFKFVKGDIRNKYLLNKLFSKNKFDYVFHLAELVGYYCCEKYPKLAKEINYGGTKNVVDLALKYNVRLIYNSSSSVYGSREDPILLDENSELFNKGLDNYCLNKVLAEKYIMNKEIKDKNFEYIVFRPATVGGLSPRMRLALLPNHFIYAASQKKLSLTQPNNYRAVIDINDLIGAYMAVLKLDKIHKGIYNIGCYNMTKQQYIDKICGLVKHEVEIKVVNNIGNERNLRISSEKFKKIFGFKTSISFEESIKPLINLLEEKPDIFSKNNFKGVLNVSLREWKMLLS